jgi:hypothetical protein
MTPASDVIRITILGGSDPAAGITPGMPVEFDAFKVGISAPERNDKGGIRGGKPYFQAGGIRAGQISNGRQLAGAKAE